MKWRLWVLLGAVLAAVLLVFRMPAIPQSEAYHTFSDNRTLLGIPNCLDVVSNVFFLLVGVLGMRFVWRDKSKQRAQKGSILGGRSFSSDSSHSPSSGVLTPEAPVSTFFASCKAGARFLDSRERWPYFVFFLAVTLTAFGSVNYHLHPSDQTLVGDRLPMALGFMSLVAAAVADRISVTAGVRLLAPLLLTGVGSVFYWQFTQARGHGDLRPYALAQFGALFVLLLIVVLFPPRYTRGMDFGVALGIYGVAKLLEVANNFVFALGHIVSGHTLKHVVAAASAYWLLRMLRLRRPIARASA